MEFWTHILQEGRSALLQLLWHPLTYVGVLIVWLHLRRQAAWQRKLFAVRLFSIPRQWLNRITVGVGIGVLASVALVAGGVWFTAGAVWWVWGFMLVMGLFRLRWICMAYAAGGVGLLQFIYGWITLPQAWVDIAIISTALDALAVASVPALLAAAGLLHLMEALLVRTKSVESAVPLYLQGQRGRLVGAMQLQNLWPVPLLVLVPADIASPLLPMWWPVFGPDLAVGAGWTLLPFPLLIGFSALALQRLPRQVAISSSNGLIVFGLGLLGLAWLAGQSWAIPTTLTLLVASLFALLGHELCVYLIARRESGGIGGYVHSTKGLRVLDVVQNSPAAQMKLSTGETIYRVNGVKVTNRDRFYEALTRNPAFSKLEVLTTDGDIRFGQCAIYADSSHMLGVLLAPDQQATHFIRRPDGGLWRLLLCSADSQLHPTLAEAHVQKLAQQEALAEIAASAEEQINTKDVVQGEAPPVIEGAAVGGDKGAVGDAREVVTETPLEGLPPRRSRKKV